MLRRLKVLDSPIFWREVKIWIAFFTVTPIMLLLYLLSSIFTALFPRSKKSR
jgi:hypothetical protein